MRVLAIGAHPDDIELGCGGTLLTHVARQDLVVMLVMTSGSRGPQGEVSRSDEQALAAQRLGIHSLVWGGFNDCELQADRSTINVIERVIREFDVDMIYTHSPRDTHQDHRATATATLAAARCVSRVLCFESPSAQEFRPGVFVDIEQHLAAKLHSLHAHYSQVSGSRLVDPEAIEAQARFRGFQSRIRFAEAFEVERFVWSLSDTADAPPLQLTQSWTSTFDAETPSVAPSLSRIWAAHGSTYSANGKAEGTNGTSFASLSLKTMEPLINEEDL